MSAWQDFLVPSLPLQSRVLFQLVAVPLWQVTSSKDSSCFFVFCFLKIGCCFCYWHFLYFHYDDYNSEDIRFVLLECFDHIIITIAMLCYFLICYVDDMLLQLTLGWKRQEFDLVGCPHPTKKLLQEWKTRSTWWSREGGQGFTLERIWKIWCRALPEESLLH